MDITPTSEEMVPVVKTVFQSSQSKSSRTSSPESVYQPDINSNEDMCFGDLLSLCSGDKINLINYLQDMGLLPHRYTCPECESNMRLIRTSKSDGYWWECKAKKAGKAHKIRRSLRRNTWFARSKLTIVEIVILLYYWVKETPRKMVEREMKLDSKTVSDWYNFCREVCGITLEMRVGRIGGKGHIVELDDSIFGKKEVGEGEKEKCLIGIVDHETNECFVVPVDELCFQTILHIIKEFIFPGTVMFSDCWNRYNCLASPEFQQLQVNHSLTFKDKDINENNCIEGIWMTNKQRLLSRLRKEEFLQSYLFEFMYRRSTGKQNRFQKFLQDIARSYPPPMSG
ncbi:hypothetical protein C0J52_25555 [Blattella germanica]|nr:hypothetical protein C0J52_25555 [Blattella germanica]PSN30296.1 hypothetical protein C0J52_25555 [Blattella germanica]